MSKLPSIGRTAAFALVPWLFACTSSEPTPSSPGVPATSACEAPDGPGVDHTDPVTMDETWRASDNPHRVPSSLRVDATLTLEPCVVVELGGGASLTVGNNSTSSPSGAIVAHGTYAQASDTMRAVTFKPEVEDEFWGGLLVLPTGSLDFEYVGLVHGGDRDSSSATIDARGTQAKPLTESLRLRDVAIVDSGTMGVKVVSYAAFTEDSRGLAITGSGAQDDASANSPSGYPLDVQPPAVHTIPDGEYFENRHDEIMVRGATRADLDESFPNRGLPYFIDDTLLMYDLEGSSLTLTIEAGVTLRFDASESGGIGLALGNAASDAPVTLVAEGTKSAPILLTSAADAPEAGDWAGVLMANAPADGNVVEHTTFEYAGGFTGSNGYGCGPRSNVGGLIVQSWRPAEPFVHTSTFRATLGAGIVSGWTNAEGEDGPDLREDNQFEDIVAITDEGSCDVTEWATDPNAMCRNDMPPTCVGD